MFGKKKKNIQQPISNTNNTNNIPQEIVAAISGAIAVICGDGARITGIRPSISRAASAGRSAWSMAGILDNTRPF